MDFFGDIGLGLQTALSLHNLLYCLFGVFLGTAIGNTFQADSNAPNFPVFNNQYNNSATISNMSVNAFNVGGSVGMSSSAIGNTAQIIHYSTGNH